MSTGGTSGNPLKNPLYWLVKQDSRAASEVGRGLNWDFLVEEGKHNQNNQGRAITKAAEYALGGYLGGLYGGLYDGAAGTAAAPVIDESAGLAMNAAVPAAETAAKQVAEQQALQTLAPQGIGNTMEAGMTNTGYTPSSLWNALSHANTANGTGLAQNLGNYASQKGVEAANGSLLNGLMSGSSTGKGGLLAQQMGAKMLMPQGQQPMPQSAPRQQGNMSPLPMPYGTPAGNSMGFTEEQKRKLRAQGINI